MDIVLASQSERRKQLLKKLFPVFEVAIPDVDEIIDAALEPELVAILNAEKKAKNVGRKLNNKNCTIIAADTIVVIEDKILGKPAHYGTAFEYLHLLSDSFHRVITGVCLFNPCENKILSDYDLTWVKFKKLDEQQIKSYLAKQTFYDKAGGYAVQEVNDEFIEEIKGDFDNVVGLPVEKLKNMLAQFSGLREIEIHDIALPNRWGVGKQNEKIVFVDNAVPGDNVWIQIVKDKRDFFYARNCGIKKHSEFRVNTKCPYFGTCGGCSFQNLDYNRQLELKKKYIVETLTRVGKIDYEIDVSPVIPSPDIYFYRNKMEFAFGQRNKKLVLGLRERQNPVKRYRAMVNSIDECAIFSELVKKVFPSVIEYVRQNNFEPYNPITKKGFIRHLVMRHSKSTDQLMIILVTRPGMVNNLEKFVEELVNTVPNVTSFWHVENDQISDVVSFQKKRLIFGKPYIEEHIENFKFIIYPETFFQPNTGGASRLYKTISLLAHEIKPESVLGLFCGSAPIEIFLSRVCNEITGVDNNPANIETARENCRINNITNCKLYDMSAEEFLKQMQSSNSGYNLLVVDPPRGGLSNKAIHQILKMRTKNIIYVSCNPATLARDLVLFGRAGYVLQKVIPVDLFPHTSHIENCCVLRLT